MTETLKPLQIFELPDWAKWFAWIEVNPQLKIQIISLKYPRWDHSFYPIFLNQENKALFELPKDLGAAVSDGRIWRSFPEIVYFSEEKLQIVTDIYIEGDHPRPAFSIRRIISPPTYMAEDVESFSASYGADGRDRAGDIPPRLSALSSDFKECVVHVFGCPPRASRPLVPPWPIEKPRKKKHD